LSWRDRGFVATVAALMAAGHSIAVPFVANQNQYLLHAVADDDPRLAQDWLTGTTDPYPLFSAVTHVLYVAGGSMGLRTLALAMTYVALIAVFMLARQLWPRPSLGVPVVAMVLVGMTLSVGRVGSFVPLDWSVSAFQGFAGQYILMKPGYFQPSSMGVLILLTVPLWIAGFRTAGRSGRRLLIAALITTVVASALAPTYLVVSAMGLGAALIADLLTGRRFSRLPWYAGTVAASAVVTILTNPAIVSLGTSDPDGRDALTRLAFDAFPIHTLFSSWPPDDSTILLVIAAAVIVASGLSCSGWITRWILVATAVALLTAGLVYVVRSPSLAFLFPWRISVIVAPVAATVIAVQVSGLLRRLPRDHWRWKVLLVAAVIAVPGVASTVAKQSPAVSEAPVATAVAAQPQGVGLIPLSTGTLRLNARLPVYVDAMSPPYASDDLIEWWRRVDDVSEFWREPESFCSADWAAMIDWMLLPAATPTPSCAADWVVLESTSEWTVLQRP
jgi:hypothetical protein